MTFCSVNLSHLPRSSPEELSMLSVLDRLAVAELKLNKVSEASSSHIAQLSMMISDVLELKNAVYHHLSAILLQYGSFGAIFSGSFSCSEA